MDSSEECCDDSAQSDELYTAGCESSLESFQKRKRKLALITASEKRDLCLWKREHPRSTLKEVALWGRINLNLDLAKSTVSRILQESDKWIDTPPEVADGTSSRSPHVADLEKSLVTWIHEARSRGVYVSDLMIVEKARSLGKYLSKIAFCISVIWVIRGQLYLITCHCHYESASPCVFDSAHF